MLDNLKSKAIKMAVAAQVKSWEIKDKANSVLTSKKQGAFSFEYIIVLVLMVAVIFAVWGALGDAIVDKVNDIVDVMGSNGIGGTNNTAEHVSNPIVQG